jgi:hypothetical protein
VATFPGDPRLHLQLAYLSPEWGESVALVEHVLEAPEAQGLGPRVRLDLGPLDDLQAVRRAHEAVVEERRPALLEAWRALSLRHPGIRVPVRSCEGLAEVLR